MPGGPGDIEHFDDPDLHGISETAPYFVSNRRQLEEVLDHYKAFFQRVEIQARQRAPHHPAGRGPSGHDRSVTEAEVPALLAYLRKISTARPLGPWPGKTGWDQTCSVRPALERRTILPSPMASPRRASD